MVRENHLIGEGKRKKVCAHVPVYLKDRLKDEVENMAGSYSQGVVLSQALREYLGISELADEVDMLMEVADSMGLSLDPTPPQSSGWDYESWREAEKNQINTRIPQSVYDVVQDQDETTGIVVTNALSYYLGSQNELDRVRELVRDIHAEVDTDSSEDEIKLQNIKSRDDANKRKVVIDYLHSSPLHRVTVDDLSDILINEADYAPSTSETIAESVVSQLKQLPSALVDWEECREEDIDEDRVNMSPVEYRRRYNNQYNYLVDSLDEGYCVGDVEEAVREDIEELFEWTFNRDGRRETFARHCFAEATEFDGIDVEDVEEVVPRAHRDLIDSAEEAEESQFDESDYEVYADVRDEVLDEYDEWHRELMFDVDGIELDMNMWANWFAAADEPVTRLARVTGAQQVEYVEPDIRQDVEELLEIAIEIEAKFE